MRKYCIFGDSWSYQSFKKLPDFRESAGTKTFQQLFSSAGHSATNFSVLASSNNNTLESIKNTDLTKFDSVIVFQTDPLRDIVDRKKISLIDSQNKASNLIDTAEQLLSKFYQGLSQLNCPVLLVGGLSCIAHHLVPSNIQVVDKSWTELVEPGFQDCYFEWVEFTELVQEVLGFKDEMTRIKQQIQIKNNVWQTSDAFAWCHPGDRAYEIMFGELKLKLNM